MATTRPPKKPKVPKTAFERIMAGLRDAVAIADGTADPSTYRVHRPKDRDA